MKNWKQVYTVMERRDGQKKLIGASVVNQNTILLPCVDEDCRIVDGDYRLILKTVRDI